MKLIDSHCHIDDPLFRDGLDEVLQRAQKAGVERVVVPSVKFSGWSHLKALSEQYTYIAPAFGLHPWFCDSHHQNDIIKLPEYLNHAVAIGECGLDTKLCPFDMETQLHWLRAQLQVASDHNLPVILHAYKAVDPLIRELKSYPKLRGVIHGFSGSQQQAERLIDMGLYLGIGGAITHIRATKLQHIVKTFPLERLLLETDAPYQPPASHQGERNEPAFLIEILTHIATLRGISPLELASNCNNNARELFNL